MIRLSRLVAVGAVLAFAAGAFALDVVQGKVGLGSRVGTGTKLTADVGTTYFPDDDLDDYVIDGYAGQTLAVSVAAAAKSTLIPSLQVIRPDGSILDYADGAKISPPLGKLPSKKATVSFKLDQTGAWTIRVRGAFPATGIDPQSKRPIYDFTQPRAKGAYTISVKYGAPGKATAANAPPDDTGRYRFFVSGDAGAVINATLKFTGGTPSFEGISAPNGAAVTGITPAVKAGKSLTFKNVIVPARYPLGLYAFDFQADPDRASTKVSWSATVKPPKSAPARKGKFAAAEPVITAINPSEGGPGTRVTVSTSNVIDPGAANGDVHVFLGRYALENIVVQNNGAQVLGTVPADIPEGTFDVIVESTTGQAAVAPSAFTRVPPPAAYTIDPTVGSAAGGFTVTITGANFNPALNGMQVGFRNLQGGAVTTPPVTFSVRAVDELQFSMPMNLLLPGQYKVRVIDARTQLFDELDQTLELTNTAAINRVTPGLVPVIGGDTVYVRGSNFTATDHVFMETAPGSGVFDDVTASQATYVSPILHQFVAPAKPKGVYRVKVRDVNAYETPTRSFAYYQFADFSATLALPNGTDPWDAWTTALADMDKDGDLDLFLSRKGGATTIATSPETRVLRNSGGGAFTDVTSSAMPATRADDDWRADRIWVSDVTTDGYPDILIVTDSDRYPAKDSRSHLRILVNERRSPTLPATERTFVDRTLDLMAPMRRMSILYGGNYRNDADDWRGKDMWVGDLDLSTSGPPEILITSDREFENIYVGCQPYCASPYSGGYTYDFYWGGTRMFKWDPTARSGLGRYKYDANFFPRKSGVTVPIFNPPPGVTIPTCNGGSCRSKVTPFTGQRLAVGPIDLDGKPDIAVLNSGAVTKEGATISSLQVALNRANISDGANVTDITSLLSSIADATYWRGNAVAIGSPGYPDGNAYGNIAVAKSDPTGVTGTALRLLRYKPPQSSEPTDLGSFEEITDNALPAWSANDRFHASQIAFVDVDQDGDADMITLARTAPGGNRPGFRIFRNEVVLSNSGVMTQSLTGLITPLVSAAEYFTGDALAIGDLDGDGALEFVTTRSDTTGGTAPHTRAITTDN